MDLQQLLALYDEEERIKVEFPNQRREPSAKIIRHVSLEPAVSAQRGFVIYSRLDESSVEQAIQDQVDYYRGLGGGFEWKVFDHDTPGDLRERLAAHGFEVDEAEAIMVLELDQAPLLLLAPVTHDLRRITDPALVDDVLSVQNEVWQDSHEDLGDHLRRMLSDYPSMTSVYAVYADGRPVASAWLYFDGRSPFASLWGGSTLPAYRKQGIYTALLAVRVQEAIAKGALFLTIDASAMSRPIVARFGFRQIATAYACTWSPESPD